MFFEQPSIETTLSIEYSGGCARPYGHTCRRFMVFAASGENLFKARCGAKDFFDKLKPSLWDGFFDAMYFQKSGC